MATSRRTSAAADARERIKEYILEHRLGPGDLLPTELELCSVLGVSRSSVREAVSQLDALDIVHVQHGRGTYVGDISLAPLVDSVSFRCMVDQRDASAALREIVEVRQALELGQAGVVVSALTGGSNADLHELVASMIDKANRRERFAAEDRAFHTQLLERSTSNHLAENLIGAFWDIHTFVVDQVGVATPEDIAQTAVAHGAMLRAAEAGDLPGYIAAVCDHYRPLLDALTVPAA